MDCEKRTEDQGQLDIYPPERSFPRRHRKVIPFLCLLLLLAVSCSEDAVVSPQEEDGLQKETRLIADIDYVSNIFFFLDNPNGPFLRPKAGEVEVWVSITAIERQNTDIVSFYGLAFVDTTARGTPIRDAKAAFEAGQETPPREEAYFKELWYGTDYQYILDLEDESVIGIELFERISDDKVLAVRYVNELNDSIGDYSYFPTVPWDPDQEIYPIFLELIKARNPRPVAPFGYAWNFMLRNIYHLGISSIDPTTLEIEIEDLSNNQVKTHPPGETVPYLRIFGLDRFNESGVPGPDNRIDLQAGLIDFNRGLLTFPSLRPFDPHITSVAQWTHEDTSFVLPDDYERLNLANPDIYDEYLTGTDLQNARRYNIIVRAASKCPCTKNKVRFDGFGYKKDATRCSMPSPGWRN